MKRFSILLVAAVLLLSAAKGQTVQGSIKVTGTGDVTVYAKSSATLTTIMDNLNITISVPSSAAAGITVTLLNTYVRVVMQRVAPATYEANGRVYYTFIGINSGGYGSADLLLTAGAEVPLVTLHLDGATGNPVVQLNDLAKGALNGGNSGQSYWYFQTSPQGEINDKTTLFYATPQSVTGTDASGNMYAETLSTLPVTISSFSAAATAGCGAALRWTTATEVNSSRYGVEVSADGKTFAAAGTVASKNAANGSDYSFTYTNTTQGVNYFRLKVVDKDGTFFYSNTAQATVSCGAQISISVSPNPVQNRMVVKGLSGISNTIRVYTVTGQLVATKVTGNAVETLNASGYARGTYVVLVTDAKGNKVGTVKVVKE